MFEWSAPFKLFDSNFIFAIVWLSDDRRFWSENKIESF